MSSWISFEDALRKLDKKPFEIFTYLKEGLRPYSDLGMIPCPKSYHEISLKEIELSQINYELNSLEPIRNLKMTSDRHIEISVHNRFATDIKNLRRHLDTHKKFQKKDPQIIKENTIYASIRIKHFSLVESGRGGGNTFNGTWEETISFTSKEKEIIENEMVKLNSHKEQLLKEINTIKSDDPNCISWKYFIKPSTAEGAKNVISNLKKNNAMFKNDDVQAITNKLGLGAFEIPSKQQNTGLAQKSFFPCKPGTKWEDVKITLIENDVVNIETPYDSGQFSYQRLEMAHKKSGNKPYKIWEILKLFATYTGRLDSEIPESARRILLNDYKIDTYKKLPDYTKRLNKHLRVLFGIDDSIFKYHYNKYKEYITKIEFSDRRELKKSDHIENTEKSLHTDESKEIQNKYGIPDSKRFDT